ncbi:unnamed protein product [Bursaphelenchus xylophilus]|uniref:(pine wood nematode) hypothetical protein n=1 Tax=Bursaphelenchus xylophilus TaxID=6326 RepID=A0A1I7RWK9_BURXY|nr:unnamed protein product [Bursaphelenchus xylophilus]CAG9128462.1 unnamed protein product [Bursaphelenchus xylophilus]
MTDRTDSIESTTSQVHRQPRHSQTRPSIVSRISMASAKLSVVSFEPTQADETPWPSIYVMSGLACCQAIQFSMYFTPMWPYLNMLDPDASIVFFGLIIAAYSFGHLVSAPFFDKWRQESNALRPILLACLIIMFIGHLIYFLAASLGENAKWAILVSRAIVGTGESSLTIFQSYAASSSLPQDRPKAIAISTTGLAFGGFVGPCLQLVFWLLGEDGLQLTENLRLNMYTAGPIVCCALNVIGIFLVLFVFEECYVDRMHADMLKENELVVMPYDRWACVVCLLTRFAQLFAFTNMETIGAIFIMTMFAMSRVHTVLAMVVAQFLIGLFTVAIHNLYTFFDVEKWANLRQICISAVSGFFVFYLVTYTWPFLPGHIQFYAENATNLSQQNVGCDADLYGWCEIVSPINFWLYMVAFTAVFGLCMPNMNLALGTLFLRILGNTRQAQPQSWFLLSGSAGRIMGPILLSRLFTMFGPQLAWLLEMIVLVIVLIFWFVFYTRMIPAKIFRRPTFKMTSFKFVAE